jgi:hypothetical protein
MPTLEPFDPGDGAGDALVGLELDRDALADFGDEANRRGHQAAGRDVADQAELAPAADDQGADPQDGHVARLPAPLRRLRRRARKGEGRLLDAFHRTSSSPSRGLPSPPVSGRGCTMTREV